ncbi:hypothetical protein MMC07_001645 [Pseudocyphellaria aurata]|nr:hypothetical protein [Pseudocyphellaria aurata]
MHGPLYFAINLLSIPILNSIVIKRDPAAQIQPMEPFKFDANYQIGPPSTEFNPDVLGGLTTPNSAYGILNTIASTYPIQDPQISSSEPSYPDANQNQILGITAPYPISSGQDTVALVPSLNDLEEGERGTNVAPPAGAMEGSPPIQPGSFQPGGVPPGSIPPGSMQPGSTQPFRAPAGNAPVRANLRPLLKPGETQVPAEFEREIPDFDPYLQPQQGGGDRSERGQAENKDYGRCPESMFGFRNRPLCDSGKELEMGFWTTEQKVNGRMEFVDDWVLMKAKPLMTGKIIFMEGFLPLVVESC